MSNYSSDTAEGQTGAAADDAKPGKRYVLFVSTDATSFSWGVPFAVSNSVDTLKDLLRVNGMGRVTHSYAQNRDIIVAQASILDTTRGLIVARWEQAWRSPSNQWLAVEMCRHIQSV